MSAKIIPVKYMRDIYKKSQKSKKLQVEIFNCKNILYLAPHPDDEIIGCGGSLLRHKQCSQKITGCYITDGRWGINKEIKEPLTMSKLRLAELQMVGKYLQVSQVITWRLEDLCLEESTHLTQKMTELIEEEKPDLIYAPSIFESHPDHYYTAKILIQVLYNLMKKGNSWFTEIAEEGHIHFYSVWSGNINNLFVDITEVWKEKQQMLNFYQSQLSFNIIELAELRGKLHAIMSPKRNSIYSEAFYRASYASIIEINEWVKERSNGCYV